ncbi:ABC transporter permease [Kribbella deserti]|uniref:ABC transporter permease n=1 Tax=Kribbella deserti TaxID=1926257 RepID=A0ABV6QHI8_9ACTN
MTTKLTGTGTLLRLALRRDRIRLPIWVLAIGLGMVYAVTALGAVYATAADRQVRADLMKSPAATMMSGPGYGLDNYSLGAMVTNEMVLWLAVPAAMMSIFAVIRHTRAEEETGRAELVRSGVVGRAASDTAAVLLALIANAAVAIVVALAMMAGGLPAADSLAVGIGIGLTGITFAAVALLTSQLTAHARAASGMAVAVIGVAFVLRAVGDAAEPGGNAVSWLSPLAWTQQTRAFVDLRWWPLLLSLPLAVAFVACAYVLAGRRDVGAGLLPAWLGRSKASHYLASPFALAARQQRGALIGWGSGLFLFAVASGSMSESAAEAVTANPDMARVFAEAGQSPVDSFIATITLFFALLVGAFVVSSLQRLRTEERTGHTEAVLATAVGRGTWLRAWLVYTVAAAAVLMLLSGLGVGLGAVAVGQDAFGVAMRAAVTQLPAVMVVAALTACLYGVRAGASSLGWIVMTYAFVIGMFGALLNLPSFFEKWSPFTHSPTGGEVELVPIVVLLAVAALLAVLAERAFSRRDLETA